jgi:hypothetical protein
MPVAIAPMPTLRNATAPSAREGRRGGVADPGSTR